MADPAKVQGAIETVSYWERAGCDLPEEAAEASGDVNSPYVTEMFRDVKVSMEMLIYPECPGDTEGRELLTENRGRGPMSDNGVG